MSVSKPMYRVAQKKRRLLRKKMLAGFLSYNLIGGGVSFALPCIVHLFAAELLILRAEFSHSYGPEFNPSLTLNLAQF